MSETDGNIIATYHLCNSIVHISDAALPKTEEENKMRWKEYYRVSWIVWEDIMSKDPVCQAYDNATSDEEREALLPALHEAGFTIAPRRV